MGHIDPEAYDAWYQTPFGALCHRLERDALFSLAEFKRGEKVLDAGCGTGIYLAELISVGAKPTGIDQDEAMLDFAAKVKRLGPMLVKGLLAPLPFKSRTFDKVLCVCALEFAADPARVLAEISRVLKNGGGILVGFLNKNSPWALARTEKGKDPASVWHGARFYGLGDIGRIAGRLDLRLRGFRGAVHFPPEAEAEDLDALARMEAEGRARCPSCAAFIGAYFLKV